jgi:hypothetical protein
LQDI